MARKKENIIIKLFNTISEWLLYMFAYTGVFIFVDYIFDSFIVDEKHMYLYSFVAVVLIYILNKTIKPVLFNLTIPITGITLGAFYFVLNMLVLKIVEFVMEQKIEFTSLPMLFVISIVLSLFNLLVENILVKPIVKKVKYYG